MNYEQPKKQQESNFILKYLQWQIFGYLTLEALALDSEVYNLNDYNISTIAERINITDKYGNKILDLSDKTLIHNTNL